PGRTRRCSREHGNEPAGTVRARALEPGPQFRHWRLYAALRHPGGTARDQNPWDFRPPAAAGRQTPLSAAYAPVMGLFAAFLGASGIGGTQCVVCRKCATSGWVMMGRFGLARMIPQVGTGFPTRSCANSY